MSLRIIRADNSVIRVLQQMHSTVADVTEHKDTNFNVVGNNQLDQLHAEIDSKLEKNSNGLKQKLQQN